MRVATLNLFGRRDGWNDRRKVAIAGFRDLQPDLVALQEVIVTAGYDQVADVLGPGFEVVHHREREPDGQGISVASRWPIMASHEVDLHVAPRPSGFAASALIVEVQAPAPVGPLLFVNHLPDWQLTHEHEREVQTVAVARRIEDLSVERRVHVVLAGDLDATPEAASIRFWAGRQSLDGLSVCYVDAWARAHPDQQGHTFSAENALVIQGDRGDSVLETGRRIDYVFVRCTDHGPTLRIARCERIFDRPVDRIWASDHFGIVADLSPYTLDGRLVP